MATVADVMTRDVRSMTPQDTLGDAAKLMDELNVGVVPICDGERLVGVVTDRDIVVRGLARDADPAHGKLADVMSGHVRTARQDDDLDDVLAEMASAQIRRMPVVDGQDRLVGILSIGDIAAKRPEEEGDVGQSLGGISSPAEPDRSGPEGVQGRSPASS
ncbi:MULTISPECIES: CBS domain-containing protein [Ramlibacter]|uniref:CBS domain-containing protein n=1 Tax=Ramlibacter pinisoli TaxID=2682844 RepID=A0A6N8IUP0_9BURK|nr:MULTISPECIES: CBS domain-containing protein [Ramlibacter]MBA2965446.1 CBS domain-containing protein [Ramlibacter sp. CGMCC 1.13660]MVQ30412.1 CBS domain-containing protein [Ramlibacter pinisoli]